MSQIEEVTNEAIKEAELNEVPPFNYSLVGMPYITRTAKKKDFDNGYLQVAKRVNFEITTTFDGVNSSGEIRIDHNLGFVPIPKARVITPGFGTEGDVTNIPDITEGDFSTFTFTKLNKDYLAMKLYYSGSDVQLTAQGILYLLKKVN
jgi:hypothetical protein